MDPNTRHVDRGQRRGRPRQCTRTIAARRERDLACLSFWQQGISTELIAVWVGLSPSQVYRRRRELLKDLPHLRRRNRPVR